jgi:hypothetical protein
VPIRADTVIENSTRVFAVMFRRETRGLLQIARDGYTLRV